MTPYPHSGHEQVTGAAEARDRILAAALAEFSAKGLAGARTEQIAANAGVNKALIYYYFENKDQLYTAALEMVSANIRDRLMTVFLPRFSPGERILRFALNHFDRILTQREFQNMMQQEMIRVHRGEAGALSVLVERIFRPLHAMFEATVREGAVSGELIAADSMQILLASLGMNVFYFLSAPVWRLVLAFDPFDAGVLKARRLALVELLGQAIFQDRRRGAELAARVLAETPMPEISDFKPLEVKE